MAVLLHLLHVDASAGRLLNLLEGDLGLRFNCIVDLDRKRDEGKAEMAFPIAGARFGMADTRYSTSCEYVVFGEPGQRERPRNNPQYLHRLSNDIRAWDPSGRVNHGATGQRSSFDSPVLTRCPVATAKPTSSNCPAWLVNSETLLTG